MKNLSIFPLLLALIVFFGCTSIIRYPDTNAEAQNVAKQESVPVQERMKDQETKEATRTMEESEEEQLTNVTKESYQTVEKKEEFKIFNPAITYQGAYNGPLYGTSEQVGSAPMDLYFENLDRNGINFFIGMFGISGEPNAHFLGSDQGLGEVIYAAQKHPQRIIPFFNPGIGGEEIEQEGYLQTKLFGWYKNTLTASQKIAGKDFIRGFGEVEMQEWRVRHNDPKIIELIELAKANEISVMFHPVASKISDVEKIVEAYPNIIFLMHMYREDLEKSKPELIDMLKEHDNLYFSIDAAHIIHIDRDVIYDFDSPNKESSIERFVSYYDSNEKTITDNAIKAYKPLVDAAPDKIMWGTEIGPEYAFDPTVFDRAIKASRFVIAGFKTEDQEAVGYKNALRVFGKGVVADPSIRVLDTSSWRECTDAHVSDCDRSCGIPDSDSLTPEQDACFLNCLIDKQCKEALELDIG